ncbi:MAG: hypothetical protein KGS61_17675 [Verrucomicrobia bacterium]|nr:hypothetical protein [Verrucomicrobiota bacterium]
MKSQWPSSLLSALLVLPVTHPEGWHLLKFDRIPANQLSFTDKGLRIRVRNSAGPVVRMLAKRAVLDRVSVQGWYSGELHVPPGRQGEKHFDDYVLRLGLIEPGPHRLSAIQTRLAPQWIHTLQQMLPSDSGVRKIYCLDVGNDPARIGKEHDSASSPLFRERVVAVPDADGRFAFSVRLRHPTPTIGIWIGSDGDDSHSSFTVLLEKVELNAVPQAPAVHAGTLEPRPN